MPKARKGPLIVISHPWVKGHSYRDKLGKLVKITKYQEARDYAAQNEYTGIKIITPSEANKLKIRG